MTFGANVNGGTGAGKRKVREPVRCECGHMMYLRVVAKAYECLRCGKERDAA